MRTAREALTSLGRRDARVVVSPGCGTPTTLLSVLASDPEGLLPGARVLSGLLLDDCGLSDAVAAKRLGWTTWHPMGRARRLVDDGSADYLPLRGSAVPAYLDRVQPDLALVRVSPPDRNGYLSLGPSVSYPRAAVEKAAVVIGEVDPAVPRTGPHSLVHRDRFDALIDSESPMPERHRAEATPESSRIAELVLELVPDDAVLQVGIGAVPEQLTARLAERERIRFVGMGSDAMIDVVRNIGPDRPAVISAVELMGSRRLMEFADGSPTVEVVPSELGQSVQRLGALERLVSVNGAAQIDLAGQVSSERVGGRHISGVGGSQDFVESARLSPGGLVVIAATSSAGPRSRIVPRLPAGDPVTLPRHVVDLVVTEQGVADLRTLGETERSDALIEIAHPDHRADLRAHVREEIPA